MWLHSHLLTATANGHKNKLVSAPSATSYASGNKEQKQATKQQQEANKQPSRPPALPRLSVPVQASMLERASEAQARGVEEAGDWMSFARAIARKHLVMAASCGSAACEDAVGVRSKAIDNDLDNEVLGGDDARVGGGDGACGEVGGSEDGWGDEGVEGGEGEGGRGGKSASVKALCIPLEGGTVGEYDKCFACGGKAVCRVLWGRSY
jgi:hypothetical protein